MSYKILVIRFSSIGDIVLTTPVIRALRTQLGAEVHFLTKEAFAPIVYHNPNVSRVITLRDDFNGMVDELSRAKYDYVIDLHHNLRTRRIKLLLARPSSSFYKLNFEKWLLVRLGVNKLPAVHIVDRYMATAKSFGIKPDGEGLDFFIPDEKKMDVENIFGFLPGKYIAIVIGAAHQTKCMTVNQIQDVINRLQHPVILLGGKEEQDKAVAILEKVDKQKVKSSVGQLDILQSASIIDQAGVLITHDTGMMHVAAALKKPQIVVWGNTVPEFGMYPYYGDQPVKWSSFEQKGLTCRPCTKLGFEKCPKGHFKCMLDHDLEKISEAANSLAGSSGA